MSQTINDNSAPTANPETISRIISRADNLFYETLFVVDVNDGSLAYLSTDSGLAKFFSFKDVEVKTFAQLTGRLGYDDVDRLAQGMSAIQSYYGETDYGQRGDLLFIADLPSKFSNPQHHKSIYKFTPLTENGDGSLRHLIGTLGLSSGTHHRSLQALNTSTSERSRFDFESGRWVDASSQSLSQIEIDVLVLSAEGLSVPEISALVCRAPDSVKSIRKRIFEKLGVENIVEAIIYATNYKLI